MQDVRLETFDGRYVTTGIVPPFQKMPEVLIWGERCFRLTSTIFKPGVVPVYREAFALVVLQTRQD